MVCSLREFPSVFTKLTSKPLSAQKEPTHNQKKSWFGGWLGGKKDGDSLKQSQGNGPIRAKLGEESSFYYDDKLKKWVNKKAGILPAAETSKPPPPKGGTSRVTSSATKPPLSAATTPIPTTPSEYTPSVRPLASNTPPISIFQPSVSATSPSPTRSVSSAAALPSTLSPHPSALLSPSLSVGSPLAGPPSAPHSAPPSRPATGMSNASSIDDLIGAPQPRKGGTVRKGKKGRGYVDVMAK